MNKTFIATFVLVSLFLFLTACEQKHPVKTDQPPEIWLYLDHPSLDDNLCRMELIIAKQDLKEKGLVFCSPFAYYSSNLRYEQELRALCGEYGLRFEYKVVSDVETHETEGCYSAFMDRAIAAKFGTAFKQRLESRADSLFIAKSQTSIVDYLVCDTQPHLPGEDPDPDTELDLNVKVSSKLIAHPRPEKGDYGSLMRISFLIEKSGRGHDFTLLRYVDAGLRNNAPNKYQEELWQIAQAELRKIPLWVPGLINGKKVRTRALVRVHFRAK